MTFDMGTIADPMLAIGAWGALEFAMTVAVLECAVGDLGFGLDPIAAVDGCARLLPVARGATVTPGLLAATLSC